MSEEKKNSNNTSQQPATTSQPRRNMPVRRGGGPMALIKGEKPKNFKGTMVELIRYLGSYKIAIAIVLLVAAASATFSIIGPKILGQATTKIFEGVMARIRGNDSAFDFVAINAILLRVVFLYLISALFGFIQGWIMSGISIDITYRFRKDISQKINRLPLKYFDHISQGEVLSRVTNDVDVVSQTLNQSLSQIITSATSVIGILVMMFTISWTMTLIALLSVPLTLLVINIVVNHSQKYFVKQQEYLGHVNGHIEEMYGGHVVLKAFNGEAKSIETFLKLNDTLYETAWKSQFLSHMIMPIMRVISNLSYVAVSILGGALVVLGRISVGDIQAFISYVRSFNQPLMQIANISNILQQTAAAAERVFEFLNEEEEIPDVENPVTLEKVHGQVEFKNVQFGYDPEKVIIHDFSVKVKPGQKIAIVGPTGAGKTTLVKLLMRFYDVNQGEILVDGYNIKQFTRKELRNMFAMVLQDTWLYNDTIRENIRYGREDATDEAVMQAAQTAHVDHFIRTLPGGCDMILNEEATNVSAGQKQLLTIARAVLADPEILILDEATSSVDTRTEVLIQKAMDKLMQQRTSFIIAHRLSTIRNADMILVLRDGDIVEKGKHEELLAENGFYADLYYSQFETQLVNT